MQVGDANGVVFVVVEEEQLVERLGHVIDAAGIRGVQDLLGEAAAIGLGHFHREIALRNRGAAVGAVAVDPHGAQVDDVGIEAALHNGGQQVVGAVDVVIDGVALGGARFHRIGGGPLFGEMDDCFGPLRLQQIQQARVVLGDVEGDEAHRPAAHLLPGGEAILDRGDRRERLHAQIDVDLAPTQVVDDHDIVAGIRQIHRAGPATEAVAAENENLHPRTPVNEQTLGERQATTGVPPPFVGRGTQACWIGLASLAGWLARAGLRARLGAWTLEPRRAASLS